MANGWYVGEADVHAGCLERRLRAQSDKCCNTPQHLLCWFACPRQWPKAQSRPKAFLVLSSCVFVSHSLPKLLGEKAHEVDREIFSPRLIWPRRIDAQGGQAPVFQELGTRPELGR